MSRTDALAIFRSALEAADPARAISTHVKLRGNHLTVDGTDYSLSKFHRIHVLGAGKAGMGMAQAIQNLLGERITDGWIDVPSEPDPRFPAAPRRAARASERVSLKAGRIVLHPAGHPVPDQASVAGARRIAGIARESGVGDLLIVLISGGASALMALPAPGVTLAQKAAITRKLLARGATIHELNAVRKHLSAIKGGRLAALAYPATMISLILSDVIGDDLDVIGSGPTVPDRSTIADTIHVLEKFGLDTPAIVRCLMETPKPGAREFSRVQNVIVGSNRQSIAAAARKARELGYDVIVLSTTIDGETRDIARMHAAIARETMSRMMLGGGMIWGRLKPARGSSPGRRRICFLSGGETTVTIRGSGLGGRNQEFVLAGLDALAGDMAPRGPRITIFSAGTDGIDGPTDAAGAVADFPLLKHAAALKLDPRVYLANNNSYRFFEQTSGLVKTGHTGTNVMDVRILLIN